MRPAPMINSRCAPRWMAGDSGAVWRIEPSPNHSSCPSMANSVAGKTKGIADEASRCAGLSSVAAATRCDRTQAGTGAADW